MLKERIRRASYKGVRVDHVKDNYSPIGTSLIADLVSSGEYVLGWRTEDGDTTTNIETVKQWRDRDWIEIILLSAYKS